MSAPNADYGAPAAHAIITPECRVGRGDEGAWDEAVERAKAQYDAIVEGWQGAPAQPTLHLVLGVVRPAGADKHHLGCSAAGWPCPINCQEWPTVEGGAS